MKLTKKFWGIAAIIAVIGFMSLPLTGCQDDDSDDDDSNTKKKSSGNSISITGITGKTGDASIYVVSGFDANGMVMVAAGMGKISSSSVTFSLVKDAAMTPWTGNGSYYLMLGFDQDDNKYYYTNGETITISAEDENFYDKLPKYEIKSATSTIAFNLFKEITLVDNLTGTVAIDNTAPKVGDTLTATYSGGNGTGTATWQWIQGESTNIGTDSNTYTVAAADEGKTIKVQVSFADQNGSKTSAATGVVTAADNRPALTGTVAIDNTAPNVGDTLTAAYSGGNGTGTATWQWIQGESTNIGTNSNTYILVAADQGKTIKVKVSYADQKGSVTSTATAAAGGQKPAAPTGLTIGTITSTSIAVTWTIMNGVSGYTVYAGTTAENMTQKGTPTSPSFTITGLTANTKYHIAVSAKNASGEGAKATPITATTLLAAPTGLAALPISASNTIQLSWNTLTGADSYKVYRSTSETGTYTSIGTTSGTSYNDTGLTVSTDYYYKVSALTSAASGSVEGDLSGSVLGRILAQTKAITQFRFADFSVNGTISGTNISVTVPNIVNLTTLVPTITHNGKSITPASDLAQDFTSPVHYTVTADDDTMQGYTVTVTVTSNSLATAFSWINSNAIGGKTYKIVAQANESLSPTTINAYSGTSIILSGGTTEKTISLSSNGSLFTIIYGTLTLENNITLQGLSSNNASLVKLSSSGYGKLVMKDGSKIQNNTVALGNNSDALGGGVYIDGGTFTMDGGTISGNKVQSGTSGSYSNTTVRAKGGGVYFYTGTFIMNGGTISNNTAYSAYYPTAGGGVYVDDSEEFVMNGGTISNNTAESSAITATAKTYGGGVAAWDSSKFTMTGGTISGNNAKVSGASASTSQGGGVYIQSNKFTKTGGTIYGSNASPATLQNSAKNTSSGHAVYALLGSTTLLRNTTAGTSVNMNSNALGSAGGWE